MVNWINVLAWGVFWVLCEIVREIPDVGFVNPGDALLFAAGMILYASGIREGRKDLPNDRR